MKGNDIYSHEVGAKNTQSEKIIDEKINLNPRKIIISKTDKGGRILFANDYFVEVTGYSYSELMGAPHNIIRHPDMPKAVFYLMWDRLKKGNNIKAVVKNLTKSGKYYWVMTDFEIKKDSKSGEITYIAYRQPAPQKAIDAVEPLYKTLVELEETHGMDASLLHLQGFIEVRHTDYDHLIEAIIKQSDSIWTRFFNRLKKNYIK